MKNRDPSERIRHFSKRAIMLGMEISVEYFQMEKTQEYFPMEEYLPMENPQEYLPMEKVFQWKIPEIFSKQGKIPKIFQPSKNQTRHFNNSPE